MKKIVELLIKNEEFESDKLGVDTVALVSNPAIGYTWLAFDAEEEAPCDCNHYEMNDAEVRDMLEVQDKLLMVAEVLGEEHDPELTTYLTIENFEDTTVSGVADAIKALDILTGRSDVNKDEMTEVWKYVGPPAERKFCKAMMRLSRTKFWKYEDIQRMSASAPNTGFGPDGGDRYDIFKYAGGPNCKHGFLKYKMYKDPSGRTLLIRTGEQTEAPIDMTNNGWKSAASRSRAAQKAARTRAKSSFTKMEFQVQDEDQRIVVAPAMVPNNLIRRVDDKGMEYFVYFSKETVADIAEKYFANNFTNNTNINHDGATTKENTVLESWIVQDTNHDKSNLYGFNVPEGTWMMSMRINNDTTWQKIKEGELTGFSIEGSFLELSK